MTTAPHPTPCMGGWCTARVHCLHYTSPNRAAPVERLCATPRDVPLRAAVIVVAEVTA